MGLSWVLPIPVLLPLLCAGLTLVVGRRPKLQQVIALLALSTTTVASIVLCVGADSGPVVLDVGSWAAPIGVTLIADRLSAALLVVSQIVTLSVLVYSFAQNHADDTPRTPIAIYFPTFLILSAGVSNAFLTGDLFNLYVGVEILLASSFVLITLGATKGRVRAGSVYVVISLVSSAIFLGGIALTYAATGTVNIAQLTVRLTQIDPGVRQMIHIVLLVAFGIKAAVFPLQAWLPDSYPTAPAPVTAVFAGLMTKVGVYALIRLEVMLFPSNRLTLVLCVIGISTMLVGIIGAIAQDDAKRLLSFTLVSHIGFMIWGLTLLSRASVAATIYYAAHHIIVQTSLFLLVGLIERRTGTTSLSLLSGLLKSSRFISLLFFTAMLNLVGIPPFTGFVGKLGLTIASAQVNTPYAWALCAAGMVTSFLTLVVVIKWWNMAFLRPRPVDLHAVANKRSQILSSLRKEEEHRSTVAAGLFVPTVVKGVAIAQASRTDYEKKRGQNSTVMKISVASLIGVQLLMAVFSGHVWAYIDRAARDTVDTAPYVEAVLTRGNRGTGTSDEKSGGEDAVSPSPNPSASPLPKPTNAPKNRREPSASPSPKKMTHSQSGGDQGSTPSENKDKARSESSDSGKSDVAEREGN